MWFSLSVSEITGTGFTMQGIFFVFGSILEKYGIAILPNLVV
jgi:hypothetical protein